MYLAFSRSHNKKSRQDNVMFQLAVSCARGPAVLSVYSLHKLIDEHVREL